MMMTGRIIDAAKAHAMDLVDLLASEGQLDRVLGDFGGELIANSGFTNFNIKRRMIKTDRMSLIDALAHELRTHPGVAPDHEQRLAKCKRR
jgi:enoyl-CoA hydratase/carnithine racemase